MHPGLPFTGASLLASGGTAAGRAPGPPPVHADGFWILGLALALLLVLLLLLPVLGAVLQQKVRAGAPDTVAHHGAQQAATGLEQVRPALLLVMWVCSAERPLRHLYIKGPPL